MRLYFIRHGETHLNREGRIQGCMDTDLNLIGFKQARLCAQRLSTIDFDYAFTSPLKRAIHTAEELLRERDIVIHKMIDLNDIDVGVWEGLKWSEVMRKYSISDRDFDRLLKDRGGESSEEVYDRVEHFFKEIDCLSAKNILVVTHAAIVYTAIKKVLAYPKDKRIAAKCENASITIIERDKHGKWAIRTLNDCAHLEAF